METDFLFVYGTLLPKSGNTMSEWLESFSSTVCRGKFHGTLYQVKDYPGACHVQDCNSFVHGVILKLSKTDCILDKLDEYEEVGNKHSTPNEFRRIQLEILCEDNIPRICWVYVYNWPVDNLVPIYNGVFREFNNEISKYLIN